jgi:hypothetical protein
MPISFKSLVQFEQEFEEHIQRNRGMFDRKQTVYRPRTIQPEPVRLPKRTGMIGMMPVDILWMGQTANGQRAKVIDSKNPNAKPFWVDMWKVKVD